MFPGRYLYIVCGCGYIGWMATITHTMVIERLRKRQGKRTLREFAQELKISYQYLADVYTGRRGLGETVLKQMNLVKNPPGEPTYREVQE